MRRSLPFACGLALVARFLLAPLGETDTGWHIALGRLVLAGGIPRTNALSWKYADIPWYDTSWLWDLLSAVAQGARASALPQQLLALAFVAATLWLLAVACAREGSAWVVPCIALLLVPRAVPRPLLASWVVLAAALAARSRRERALAVLAVAIASNFHTGAAFGAFVLGLSCLEAWARERRGIDLLLAALAGLALFANPGGLQTPQILFEHLSIGEVVQLREFERPTFASEPGLFVLLPIALGLAAARARRKPALLAATVVFAVLGLRTQRMVYEAELVFAPSLAWGLSLIPPLRFARAPLLRGAVATLAAALALVAHRLDRVPLRLSPAWNADRLPVRAARFITAHHLGPPFFNGLRDGGYLDFALGTCFFEGREFAYPAAMLRRWQEAEESRAAFQAFLRDDVGAEWALATRSRERLGGYRLVDGPQWALVHWDSSDELFVRRDAPAMAALLPLEYRDFRPDAANVRSPGIFQELDRFEELSPDDPTAALIRCAAASRQGRKDAPALCDAALVRGAPAAQVAKARAQQPDPSR